MAKQDKVTLVTPLFRVGFPHLDVPTAFVNKDGSKGKEKYNLVAIFTPGEYTGAEKDKWVALVAEMDKQCLATFGKKWADCKKVDEDGEMAVPNFKAGLYNGKKKTQDGFGEGTWYGTLSTEFPPGIAKYNGKGKASTVISVEEQNMDEIYAGIYGRAKVGVYAYNGVSKGCSIGLNSFQKVKDGDRLDGRGSAVDDFEDDIDGSYLDQDESPVEADPFA